MKWFAISLLFLVFTVSCSEVEDDANNFTAAHSKISCNDGGCTGIYKGPEFLDGDDVAHQFSNLMADSVGVKLKQLYRQGKSSRVQMDSIKMTTSGMRTGTVRYRLKIPFLRQKFQCLGTTAFDHVGGWGHKPALAQRRKELSTELLRDDRLDISPLYTTPQGLQEYWIQWRHKEVQTGCNW